jgi:protein TonB
MSAAAPAAPWRDRAWRRFPALLAAAPPITTLGFLIFVRLLEAPPAPPVPPLAIAAELVELTAPPSAARTRDDEPILPAAAPPSADAPVVPPPPDEAPPAPPPPPSADETPPPRPVDEAPPPPPPRAKPRPPPRAAAPLAPSAPPAGQATTSAPANPAPAPPSPPSSPAGDRMGARAIYQPKPEIPEALRHRNFTAVAIARFRVAADGIATVELLQATGDLDLNKAILEALAKWRFFPAMQDGKPVASILELRLPIEIR